jgi:RND family efflux transporter MFP subunit
MANQLSLHVVAHHSSILEWLLKEQAGLFVRVRHHSTLPSRKEMRRGDALVICLDDPSRTFDPRHLLRILNSHEIWLAYSDGAIPACWLDAAHQPNVHVMRCASLERAAGMQALATALAQSLVGPGPAETERLVLAKEPALAPVQPLVRAICEHPWHVRRPIDLAAVSGTSLLQLRRILEPLGFGRVEHFITFIRWVATEQLIVMRHLSREMAEHFSGITDRSNLRRQLKRAQQGSPRALAGLGRLLGRLGVFVAVLTDVACREKSVGQAAASPIVATASDSAIAVPVTGAVVRRGDLILTIRTTGQIRAERKVSLKGEAQGTVLAVLVRPGDRADSGQVLVRLDPRPFDLAIREAETQVADASVRYRDILIGEDTTASLPEGLERRRNARLRAGVDGAEARLERARLDRERATLQAPFAGTVDEVQVVVGQRLAPGDPIVTLVDLRSLIVEAAVLEHDLPLVRRGAKATVSLAAGGGAFYAGRVRAVLPVVDTATRAGRALISVTTRNDVLRPGMYADVDVEATRLPGRVIVPALAIIERDGRALVFRYGAGKAAWVYVTPGRSNGRETEVLPDASGRPGVLAGDTVLVEGHLTLTHDAPVRLSVGNH